MLLFCHLQHCPVCLLSLDRLVLVLQVPGGRWEEGVRAGKREADRRRGLWGVGAEDYKGA